MGFLNFFSGILLNYRKYLVYAGVTNHSDTSHYNGFMEEEFLKGIYYCQIITCIYVYIYIYTIIEQSFESLPFMSELVKTQAFAQFISERITLPEQLSAPPVIKGDRCTTDKLQNDQFNRLLDCLYFDECIDAKLNRYAARRYRDKIDTPFLDSNATQHVKTYVPPSPDILDLPLTDDGQPIMYCYDCFPKLK